MAEATEPPDGGKQDEGDDDRRESASAERGRGRRTTRSRRTRRDKKREKHDDPRAFALILERRWDGSAAPTADRYAIALRQWAALPGAVAAVQTTLATSETGTSSDGQPSPETDPLLGPGEHS